MPDRYRRLLDNIFTPVTTVRVDHHYGGRDNLTYITTAREGVQGATVLAYRSSDYNEGNDSEQYIVGRSMTDEDGRWLNPMLLPPGRYVICFTKPGEYGPDIVDLVV